VIVLCSPTAAEPTRPRIERLDRELDQLLRELRVAMPGVFREHPKPRLVAISSRFALAGLVAPAVAMNGAILLVTDLLFDGAVVVVPAVLSAAVFVGLWFVLGELRRISSDRSHDEEAAT